MVWIWAIARQVMLLYEFDQSVVAHTLLEDVDADEFAIAKALVAGARVAVQRLSKGGDQTSRVLGGGVEARWRGRLANVQDFLQQHGRFGRLSAALLEEAGVSEEEMRRCVGQLVVG